MSDNTYDLTPIQRYFEENFIELEKIGFDELCNTLICMGHYTAAGMSDSMAKCINRHYVSGLTAAESANVMLLALKSAVMTMSEDEVKH